MMINTNLKQIVSRIQRSCFSSFHHLLCKSKAIGKINRYRTSSPMTKTVCPLRRFDEHKITIYHIGMG
jgi:hypothetical protein